MRLFDQHTHTCFSVDSEADPAENIVRAVEMGLAGLSFTDHYDTHPIERPTCRYDYDALAKTVGDLRSRYGRRIQIGLGIEVCYQPEQMASILDFLDSRPFDVVLLSVHWTQGRAAHLPEHWGDWNLQRMTRAYLQTVLDAVTFAGELARQGRRPFQVLGHLDMIKRYTNRFRGGYDIRPHRDLVDEILRGCLDAGLVPELNTSSWRQGLDEPMPADWVVRRYAELGGDAMSLGSDGHERDHIGADFDRAAALLADCGIRHLAIFENRQMRCEPM